MAEQITYHSLRCRGVTMNHATGELSYDGTALYMPVGQFIGSQPLSENCDSFSLEIVNSGMRSYIGIGLCHKRYSEDRQPGWDNNSIGYHADDGGIYHEYGFPHHSYGCVDQGEVMECRFNFHDKTVTFLRNGTQVFTSEPLIIPHGGFYPIIGLHSPGEVVRLLETVPWSPDSETWSQPKDIVFHSLYCREVRVSQVSGIVRYTSMSPDVPVGQFVSECPLSPQCNKFSVEIASLGEKSCISVGVCHRCYPSNCQPGWIPNSIAYHVDNGGIYHGEGTSCAKGPRARTGDNISCEFDFTTKSFIFCRNGCKISNTSIQVDKSYKYPRLADVLMYLISEDTRIYHSPPVSVPPGGFHAAVGFHSPGEAVCLIERQPWRSQSEEFQPPPVEEKYHFTTCREALFDQATGTLSYNGESTDSVALLVSKCPLTPECNSFSVEILNAGKKCCMTISLCSQYYPNGNQPGCLQQSIGYHVGDGGLVISSEKSDITLPKATEGGIITCQLDFSHNVVRFITKGTMANETNTVTIPSITWPDGGFYAAVGLQSELESVRLCETEPWRVRDVVPRKESTVPPDNGAVPKCCICMDKGVSRFLIPCGHTFCVDCVEEWTAYHKTCPACRAPYQDVKMLFF